MTWCHQAPSHYPSQCWLSCMMASLGYNEFNAQCPYTIYDRLFVYDMNDYMVFSCLVCHVACRMSPIINLSTVNHLGYEYGTIIIGHASHNCQHIYVANTNRGHGIWSIFSSSELPYIDGLVQDCSNSMPLAMELLQFCTKPSIYRWFVLYSGPKKLVLVNCIHIFILFWF